MGALFSVVFLKLYWAYFLDHNKGSIVEVVLAIWCWFQYTSPSCLAPPLHQLICCRTPIQLFWEPTSKVVVFPFFPIRQTFKVLFLVVFFLNIIQHSKCSYITTYKLCCGVSHKVGHLVTPLLSLCKNISFLWLSVCFPLLPRFVPLGVQSNCWTHFVFMLLFHKSGVIVCKIFTAQELLK